MKMKPSEYRAAMRQDFHAFIERTFYQVNPGALFKPNWHLELLAAKLDACRRGETRRLIVLVPPRSLKSISASVALPAFWLGHDPTARLLCVSYAQDLADKHARDFRAVMQSEWYRKLFRTRLNSDRPALADMETTRGGGRLSTSVGGSLTGRGGEVIIIDDPLKPEQAHSDAERRRVNEWYHNTLLSRLDDKQSGVIIIVMQRLHEEDLVGHVQEGDDSWDVVSLPAIAQEDEEHRIWTPYGVRTHLRHEGEALHPEREPLEQLVVLRRQMGEYDFSAQYLQAPVPKGGAMVKEAWFPRYELSLLPDFDRILQSWDTANKVGDLNDYSVCTTWGVKGKCLYLLHVFRKRLNYPELKRAVKDQAAYHQATNVIIEDKASGTQLLQEFKQEGFSAATAYKSQEDKVMRLHAQTGKMENGQVFLPKDAPWLAAYMNELLAFPGGRYDDQVDSTAQALDWFGTPKPYDGFWEFVKQDLERMRREGHLVDDD